MKSPEVYEMLRILLFSLVLVIVSYLPISFAEDPVYFADPALKAAVENQLLVSDPTPTDMQGLVSLTATSKNISDITGLENAENLITLGLRLNKITNISPLAGLIQLKTLVLNNNEIHNLSPLANLTQLEHLDIHKNQLENISPLSGLTNLRVLILRDNNINNISPLAGLINLRELNIHSNRIQNISSLSGLIDMQTLWLSNNNIVSIGTLSGLPQLKKLYLAHNQINDLSPLTGFTSLTALSTHNNPLNSQACSLHIPQIKANNPNLNFNHDACVPRSLKVSSGTGGRIATPGAGTYIYEQGTRVVLRAEADPYFVFISFSGTYNTSANPAYLIMDEDYEIQANFVNLLDVIHVDVNGPGDLGPDDADVSDPDENGTADHPFDSIQEAIDVAGEGVSVLVGPGTYTEVIDFQGKSIRVLGLEPNHPSPTAYPVIDGGGIGPVVSFVGGEDVNSLLQGFIITGGQGAIFCSDSNAVLSHCLIVGNDSVSDSTDTIYCTDSDLRLLNCTIADNGGGLTFLDSEVEIKNSILWGETPQLISLEGASEVLIHYCDIAGHDLLGTVGNLDADPLFVLPGYWSYAEDPSGEWISGDYHLQSQAGRWDAMTGTWVMDALSSPCIDAGDPAGGVGSEPLPNGGVINMGAYGGMATASKSPE